MKKLSINILRRDNKFMFRVNTETDLYVIENAKGELLHYDISCGGYPHFSNKINGAEIFKSVEDAEKFLENKYLRRMLREIRYITIGTLIIETEPYKKVILNDE